MPRPFPLLWLCLSFAALLHAEPQTVTVRCVGVHDGDSITSKVSVPQWLSARIEAISQPDKYGLSQRLRTLPSAGANVVISSPRNGGLWPPLRGWGTESPAPWRPSL